MSTDTPESLYRVKSSELPSVKRAIEEFTENASNLKYWIGDAQRDEHVLLAEWEGQCLMTGRKWDERYKRPVSPWDGSSDTVVRVADSASDEIVMLLVGAFMTANPSAIQQNAKTAEAAGKVGTLLKYEMRQRMRDNLWQETNFFANWGVHYGRAVMRTGWKREFTTGNGKISAEQMAAWAVQAMQPPPQPGQQPQPTPPQLVEDATAAINTALENKDMWPLLVQIIQGQYPLLTDKRCRKIAAKLAKEGGEVEFRLPVERPGRPFVKSYCPGFTYFTPYRTDNPDLAPFKCVVDSYSEPEIWAKINTDGWDETFCEQLIAKGPAKAIENGTMDQTGTPYYVGRSMFDNAETNGNARRNQEIKSYYEVVHMWVWTVDEDHFPALFEVIFHPALGDNNREPLYAVNRLVDDFAGSQFTEWRREYKSRSPWDSRGIPRLAAQPQFERKWMRDGRINRNEMATNPPIRTTRRNSAGKPERLGMRPGAVMMEERGQESGFVPPPQFDEGSVEEEEMIMRDVSNLFGLFHKDVLPSKTQMHQQWLVWNFLTACRAITLKILQFDQQYMEPLEVSRVIGGGNLPFSVTREEIQGQFDVQLEYDVRMTSPEYVKQTWEVMTQAMNADNQGSINRASLIRWLIQSQDPTLADLVCQEPQAVAQQEADDERKNLTAATLGFPVMPKIGGNAQARLQAIQEAYQNNPTFRQAFDSNENVQKIVKSLADTYQFQIDQQNNAGIGNTGYVPPKLGEGNS